MAEGTRSRVDCERRSSRRRRKPALENLTKKEYNNDPIPKAAEVECEPVVPDCAVCLQACVYPSRLPCSHIFCFLCLKGIVSQSMKCAMCRQQIPADYLDHPDLVPVPPSATADASATVKQDAAAALDSAGGGGGYQWFYEGRDGWWRFEERANMDIEEMHKVGSQSFELLICGSLYVIDLQTMVQYRKDNPTRRRKIKRDNVDNVAAKGVAGIRQRH